jgi:signal transduction histidine kinase
MPCRPIELDHEGDIDGERDVSDTGMGIPAVELGQLSTRFFRASTATRNAVPGVGLGLTITKAIVTAHGGADPARRERQQ